MPLKNQKGTRTSQSGPKGRREPGEKDELFTGLVLEAAVKLKYQYQQSTETLFPYGGRAGDYWAALDAFNTRREKERRGKTESA